MICWPAVFTAPPALAAQLCAIGGLVAGDVAGRALGGGGEQRPESDAGDDSPPVVVDLVGDTGGASEVGTGHALERDRNAVGADHAVPAEEDALLAVRDSGIVGGEELRALGDEEVVAARRCRRRSRGPGR